MNFFTLLALAIFIWSVIFFRTRDTLNRILGFLVALAVAAAGIFYFDPSMRKEWGPFALAMCWAIAAWTGSMGYVAAAQLRKKKWVSGIVALLLALITFQPILKDYYRRYTANRARAAYDKVMNWPAETTFAELTNRCEDLGAAGSSSHLNCLSSAYQKFLSSQKSVQDCSAVIRQILGLKELSAIKFTNSAIACLHSNGLPSSSGRRDFCEVYEGNREECRLAGNLFDEATSPEECEKLFPSTRPYAQFCNGFVLGKKKLPTAAVESGCLRGKAPNKSPWERPKHFALCISGAAAGANNDAVCSALFYANDQNHCARSAKEQRWVEDGS